jgi:hypothetical protein
MVSIEAQSSYWLPLRANPLTNFFIDFLDEKPGLVPPELNISDNDNVVCNLLTYVRQTNTADATQLYQKLTNRHIRPDSEWIHNDYLVFALICAVSKFRLDSSWVRQILLQRPNTETTQRLINKSFDNLLAGNYNAKEDYHQISVICQVVIQQEQFDSARLHKMFAYLWHHSFPYFESEFLNLVSLRAIRVAFEAKGLLNPEENFVINEFTGRFNTRVASVSRVITYCFFVLVIVGISVGAAFYTDNKLVVAILAILSALGLGADFFAGIRTRLAIRIERFVKRFWGYDPQETNKK